MAVSGFASDRVARVVVAEVTEEKLIERLELTGTATSERSSSLSARTAGLVKSVAVDAGSRVEKGAVVLELDSALAELSLERTVEAMNEAREALAETRRLEEQSKQLLKTGGVPKTEAEARKAALRVQEAAFKQLEVNQREQAEILARHRLIAPFSGVIARKMAEVGEWVQTGVPVLELVEVDATRFDVQAPQELYADLTAETSVVVRLDSKPGSEFPAKVAVKVPVKDAATRAFLVRLTVDAPKEIMVPGVSGRATFQIRREESLLAVPRDALVRRPDGTVTVWVAEDGKAVGRQVEVGGRMSDTFGVRSGLKAGERVVVRGNESLQEGQPLEIVSGSDLE